MAKKPLDPKAKARRQKKIAIGGAVLLVALLAFQVPRTLKMLNQKPAPPAVPASAAPASGADVPLAPPTLAGAGGGGTPAPASPGGLVDSDPAPIPASGQLISFGLFESKDPFDPQLSAGAPAAPSSDEGETASSPSASATAPESGPFPPVETPASLPTSATISVNGVAEVVQVSAEFPQAEPIFQLVSLTESSAEIAIAGGSFASGVKTVTLAKGKPLTLMNTADGTRYELRLVSVP